MSIIKSAIISVLPLEKLVYFNLFASKAGSFYVIVFSKVCRVRARNAGHTMPNFRFNPFSQCLMKASVKLTLSTSLIFYVKEILHKSCREAKCPRASSSEDKVRKNRICSANSLYESDFEFPDFGRDIWSFGILNNELSRQTRFSHKIRILYIWTWGARIVA